MKNTIFKPSILAASLALVFVMALTVLPAQAQTLIDTHRLRVISQPYGVVKVDAAPGVINITFKKDAPIDPMGVIALIQKNRHIKLVGNEKLRVERELPAVKARVQMVRDVLRALGTPVGTR